MKFLKVFFLILIVSLFIAGCGGGNSGGGDGGSSGGGSTNPPTTGLVIGKVYDADTNQFIEGAVVTCGILNDTTDVVGGYWIDNVPDGNQTITATAQGYATYSGSINVVAGQSNSHTFTMEPLHTVSVPITKDTHVNQYIPNTAYGDSILLQPTYAANVRRDVLLYAPIPIYIPVGAEIIKVEFVGYSSDAVWDFFIAPLESSWNELNVTWATRPAQGWGLPEYDASTNGLEYRIDVTWPYTSDTYASYALQYGIAIMTFENTIADDWNGIWFYSSEHSTPSYRPWFEVTYISN